MVYTSDYPIISVTVDLACFVDDEGRLDVLLVERGQDPFRGRLALPGGFVDIDEDLEDAARRELAEETGIQAPAALEQLGAYGRPDRDPRGRTISVVYVARAPERSAATAGDDASAAEWHDVHAVLEEPDALAFDHAQILADAVRWVRSRPD